MSADRVRLLVDGEPVEAEVGQTIAAALLAAGRRRLRASPSGAPRGLYCGIGACFECRVQVEGRGAVRACLAVVEPGLRVTTSWR